MILVVVLAPVLAVAQSPADQFQLGVSRASRGQLEAAVQPFAAACAAVPEPEDACYFHGRNLFLLGRYREAEAPLRKALHSAEAGKRWRVHRALAQNFQGLGQADEAQRHYEGALKLTADGALRVDYGAFLFRQGRTAEAKRALEAAVKAAPSARAHAELGRVLLQSGSTEEAALHLEKAVELSPKDWQARLLLGKAYMRLGRTSDAEREMTAAHQGLASSTTSK